MSQDDTFPFYISENSNITFDREGVIHPFKYQKVTSFQGTSFQFDSQTSPVKTFLTNFKPSKSNRGGKKKKSTTAAIHENSPSHRQKKTKKKKKKYSEFQFSKLLHHPTTPISRASTASRTKKNLSTLLENNPRDAEAR